MYILLICTLLCTLILFFVCNDKVEKDNKIYDETISKIAEEIGNNENIAKEILNFIGNSTTSVETNKDEKIKASYYNVNTDRIVIKNTEDLKDCSRIIHIAHECIHSTQSKKLLKSNFILSNIQILYFLGIFIYFFYNKDANVRLFLLLGQLFIFVATFFVRVVLESDATYRGPQLAFDYLEGKVEKEKLSVLKKEVNDKLFKIVPLSYFSIYMQGAILLIIAQTSVLFT